MVLIMSRPTRRKGSPYAQFVKRIPRDIHPKLVGKTLAIPCGDRTVRFQVSESTPFIRFSLQTDSNALAKAWHAEASSYVERYYAAVREGRLVDLTHRQVVALAGELYADWARGPDATRTTQVFAGFKDLGGGHTEPDLSSWVNNSRSEDLEEAERALSDPDGMYRGTIPVLGMSDEERIRVFGELVDAELAKKGIPEVSAASREQLILAFIRFQVDGLRANARVTSGDYSPDARLTSIPKWEPVDYSPPPPRGATVPEPDVGLVDLLEWWWREAKAAGMAEGTYVSYSGVISSFISFLGHGDASRVRPGDVVAYKDHRLQSINPRTSKPISLKTVKATDLTALRSIFEWAVVNHKLPSNPASGITVKAPKAVKVREREFTPEEATAILEAASSVPNPHKNQTELAKRWVPWLCAYTGARVGELVQLRREDIRFEPGLECWVMRVTPEAYTVKTKEYRDIPVHPHMVAMGFIEQCVKRHKGASGFLFMTVNAGKSTVRGVWQSKKNRLQEFVRTVVTDPNVAPNHGWRHSFKSRGFEAGIEEKVLDAICGHSQKTVGREYGSVTLKTKWEAIKAFPEWRASSP